MSTNITSEHKRAFEALRSGDCENLALFSCFVDGEPERRDARHPVGRVVRAGDSGMSGDGVVRPEDDSPDEEALEVHVVPMNTSPSRVPQSSRAD